MTPLPQGLALPPLPVLAPTALTADPGDGKVFLRWNPQIEDERIVGWKVLMLKPQRQDASPERLTEPHHVVPDLTNGTPYEFAVVGVLDTHDLTPPSNRVTATPRAGGTAKVEPVPRGAKFTVGEFNDIEAGEFAVRIVFPDGQELLYDNCRPVDWRTRDGQHLLYPKPFGNGLDIGQFDARGLPRIIPPPSAAVAAPEPAPVHAPVVPADPQYKDAQFGLPHPHIGDPMTLSLQAYNHDARVQWYPPTVDGDRVTVHYAQPITALGYRAWTFVVVWETWWPIERDRHGTVYHGLARLVEVEMPSVLTWGYQVMLNNGFGPGGSRQGVVSYSSGFRSPGAEVVDFSGDRNRQVCFQHPKLPRQSGYHPNQDCLQSSPLIFYDWGTGSLTIAARSLYYHCAQASASYIEQGADGVWPNLAWDLGAAGRRTAVDTVEYLYTAEMQQPLPQRYSNARFEALGDVSLRMGVQDRIVATASEQHLGEITRSGGPVPYAERYIKALADEGVGAFGAAFHDTWLSNPYIVDERYVLDPDYAENTALRAMCDALRGAGYAVGYWYRPEVVKTSLVNVLSERLPANNGFYHTHGVAERQIPDATERLTLHGIPLVRENSHWIRRQRDGAWPTGTPYQWVPMSMASAWWDRVMWPTLVTSRRLGFSYVLQDGGFGGLSGVDYSPMLDGRAAQAVPCQPFWWRLFRSAHQAGIDLIGECTVGWKGGFVNLAGDGDQYRLWMFQCSLMYDARALSAPTHVHQLYQLYNSQRSDSGDAAVRRYARRFYAANPPPDWVEMLDLRPLPPVDVTAKVASSPVAGGATRASEADTVSGTVRPWTWGDAVWHYADGRRVVYPAYEDIDWSKE